MIKRATRPRPRGHLLVTLLLPLLLAPLPGQAQQGPASGPVRSPVQALVQSPAPEQVLEPVVVTATRLAQPLQETASSITLIERQDIEDRLSADTLDLLRETPGVSILQSGGRGGITSLFMRGAENDHTMVLIDGVKVNLGGGAFDFADVLAVNLERVEVLRGPQSALYGADALSGVVHYISRRGSGPPRVTVRALAGSDATFEEVVEFQQGSKEFGVSFGVGRVDTENFLPVNHDYRNTTLGLRLDASPAPNADFTFTLRRVEALQEFPTGSAGDRSGPLDPHQSDAFKRTIAGGRFAVQGTPWWRHVLQVDLFAEDQFFRDKFDPGADFSSFTSDSKERRYRADYTSIFTLPTRRQVAATLSAGLSAEREEFGQDSLDVAPGGAPVIGLVDAQRDNLAAYAQFDANWRKRVFFTAGARFDDNSLFGSELSPRVTGAVILPRANTKLRAAYGRGIKAPTFVENFGTGSVFFSGNPNLDAERARSYEVGFDQPLWVDRLLLSVTYFHSEFDDLISFVTGAPSTFQNIQEARSQGIETGLRADLPYGFAAGASFTLLDTEVLESGGRGGASFIEGKELLRRPRRQGSVSVTYRNRRFRGAVDAIIIGDSDDLDFSAGFPGRRATLAGYTKVNLALAYEVWRDAERRRAVRLLARADNLFDEEIESPIGFSAPGARYLFGFEANF